MAVKKDYRARIRRLLEKKNMSIMQLAEEINKKGKKVAPTYLHQIFREERHPSVRKGYDVFPRIIEALPATKAEKEKLVYLALSQILGNILTEAEEFIAETGLKFTSDFPEILAEAFEKMREKEEKPSYYKLQDLTGVTHTTFRAMKQGRVPDIKVFQKILRGLKNLDQFDTAKLAYLYVREAVNDQLLKYLDDYLSQQES
jgi:transcriptional regulator with XRE-family HTH domain